MGTMGRPSIILIHGSRSGIVTKTRQQEYDGTRTYAENSLVYPPDGSPPYFTGWHCTIGEWQWSRHMNPDQFGWNAGADSAIAAAFEFAQAVIAWNVTDGQCAAFADAYHSYLVPRWGSYDLRNPSVLQMHSQRPQGIAIGKSDVYARTDTARWNDLKDRLAKACGQ